MAEATGFIPLEYKYLDEASMLAESRRFLTLMKRRRTVRDFSDKPIDRRILENAIKVTSLAPSGVNI